MYKCKEYLMIAVMALAFLLLTGTWKSDAGILDTIKETVTGHVNDIKDRLVKEDEFITGKVIKFGQIDTNSIGQDLIHNSAGSFTIIETENGEFYLQLNDDFKSSLGPDYHVYVGNRIIHEEDQFDGSFVELGKLKNGSGASYYKLDSANYSEVLIWCKRFGAYIGSGRLEVI